MDISPTLETLRHAYAYDGPERSQTVARVAYRKLGPFEHMERRGQIEGHHLLAGNKLIRHYMGALGVRTGSGDGVHDLDAEYPEIYHGQMVREAWKQITRDERQALEALVQESRTIEDIGRAWLGCKDRGRAQIAGQALVRTGLDRLSAYWQFRPAGA